MKKARAWLRVAGWGFGGSAVQGSGFRVQECRAQSPVPRAVVQPSPDPRAQNAFERGQMLVVVLWVIGLISVAIGALAVRSTHELRLGRFPLERVQHKAAAQAAAAQAIALLVADDVAVDHLEELWATGEDAEGRQHLADVTVGQDQFSIGIWQEEEFLVGLVDEDRKLPLNLAEVSHLQRLIELVQPGGADAAAVAAAIVDWREDGTTPGSPCDGRTPACHNDVFESVDELRLVPGMTAELFEALRPYVTVYGSGLVNINTASEHVLGALGCAQLVQQRQEQSDGYYPSIPSELPSGCEPQNLTVASTVFTVPVQASASSASSHTLHLHAVVDRTGTILAWLPQ